MGDQWGWNRFEDVWKSLKGEVPTHAEVNIDELSTQAQLPEPHDESGFESAPSHGTAVVAGAGGRYPHGYRSGAPFQTGQNWPLSWELRAFEATQRPGVIPIRPGPLDASEASEASSNGAGSPSLEEVPAARSDGPQASTPAGTFELYTGRQIYDEGTLVSHSKALQNLQRKPFVEMNDEDAKELELADGDEVIVRAGTFVARVLLVVGDISRGAVFVPYDQKGLPANRLLGGDSGRVTVVKP